LNDNILGGIMKKFLVISIILFTNFTFAYGNSGCEEVTVAGNTYSTSWDGTSVTTGEGGCDDDEWGDIAAGFAVAGITYWAISAMTESEEDVEAFVSFDKVGLEYTKLSDNYFLRFVTNNKYSSNYKEHANTIYFGHVGNIEEQNNTYQIQFGLKLK
tara:strand:- start:51 stop:521 length:471 start_codon:yes stop_codon:yes gene_type:complete